MQLKGRPAFFSASPCFWRCFFEYVCMCRVVMFVFLVYVAAQNNQIFTNPVVD